MTDKRWKELMDDMESSLTKQEIAEGWHFCHEFDGLLVQGDPKESYCGDSCIKGAQGQSGVVIIIEEDYSRNGSG